VTTTFDVPPIVVVVNETAALFEELAAVPEDFKNSTFTKLSAFSLSPIIPSPKNIWYLSLGVISKKKILEVGFTFDMSLVWVYISDVVLVGEPWTVTLIVEVSTSISGISNFSSGPIPVLTKLNDLLVPSTNSKPLNI